MADHLAAPPGPAQGPAPDKLAAQVTLLHADYNALIGRINANENFTIAAVAAIFSFLFVQEFGRAEVLISLAAVLMVSIGILRAIDMHHHVNRIIEHLKMLERDSLDARHRWFNAFHPGTSDHMMVWRWMYWMVLAFGTVLGAFLVLTQPVALPEHDVGSTAIVPAVGG